MDAKTDARPEVHGIQPGDRFVFTWERCDGQWQIVSKRVVSPDGSVRQAWPPSDEGKYRG
jgi:hypothetical protein